MRAAAICTPGLEAICTEEIRAIGAKPKPSGAGVVAFEATPRQLYAANLWLRTASRVTVRVATFRATDFAHLERAAADIDWARWLPPGEGPQFRVTTSQSKLYHTEAIAERLHKVVASEVGVAAGEQLFVVRIARNTVTISADSSGAALHHRPWRTDLGPAPLRTTMAAAMVLAAKWDSETPLLDPFCGCGTIPIEAALLARRLPPGGDRSFAFQAWPDFAPGTWASVVGEASARALDTAPAPTAAADRDGALVDATIANATRAGVAADIEAETRVVSHLKPPRSEVPGLVATNPPFGKRVGDGELTRLYRRFGSVLRERLGGWSLAVLTAERSLAMAADNRLRSQARFRHGGLPVELWLTEI